MGVNDGCNICGSMVRWQATCPEKGGGKKGGGKGGAKGGKGAKGGAKGSKGAAAGTWTFVAAEADSKIQKPCREWTKSGACSWGAGCRYLHTTATPEAKAKGHAKCPNPGCQAMWYYHRIDGDCCCKHCRTLLPYAELPQRLRDL